MHSFKKFATTITTGGRSGAVLGDLRPIDTAKIAADLNLDQSATERGQRDLPASGSEALDAIEQKIIHTVQGEWSWHGEELINNLRAYASRLIGVSVQTEFARLELKARDAMTKLREANHRALADLGPLREAYISARDELSEFRRRQRLTRGAHNPARRWTSFGLLVILVVFEAGLNAVFFAKGSEFGFIGGVGTAIGISITNVLIAFFIGLGPARLINHRSYLLKAIGFITTLAGLSCLLALHAFAAHFRDATAAVGDENAFQTALDTLVRTPWILADLSSGYLFALGLLFGATAAWKGYTFDDRYPKYGAHFRRAERARNAYSDEHSSLFDELTEIREETVQAIDDGIKRIPLFPTQAATIRAERGALMQKFRAYETTVETAANELLSRYRDKNRMCRRSSPPEYFNHYWKLPHSFLNDTNVLVAVAEPATPALDANAALIQLRKMSHDILSEYDELLLKYPHPTQML